MPKQIDFRTIKIFNNQKEFQLYRNRSADFTIPNVKRVKCTICSSKQLHKMKVQYGNCTNNPCLDNDPCDWKCKIETCCKDPDSQLQKVVFKSAGKHNSFNFVRANRGISKKTKSRLKYHLKTAIELFKELLKYESDKINCE
jgi:hypothetical protein